ncbi:uncharacterized protein LOC126890092 [Diabrotica virgifera virgifera]|uniref:Endonuclease/exonuclease/phosphatase domain-containing protein n=1 Tax=Diabrotica virgifera virgifera TaxID=50390 RepID=A0ABM5KXH6_DIAVI|nr:uncharacterized protein LOC126890092 [Diabrotica virgifera virgifera]
MFNDWLLLYTNIASLNAKFTEFVCNIQLITPHIICIAESWLNNNIPDSLIAIPSYTIYRKDRQNRVGGGVCIYLSELITNNFSICAKDIQTAGLDILHLTITRNSFTMNLICLYRPPDTQPGTDNLFIELLEEISLLDNLVIVGDFNFPDISWPAISLTDGVSSHNLFKNFIINSNLSQLITKPTRFRLNNQPSTVDLVITNEEQLISTIDISSPIGKSDHAVITFHIQFNLSKSLNKMYSKTITVTDFFKVNSALHQLNWNNLFHNLIDPSSMWDTFLDTATRTISVHTTERQLFRNQLKPWINLAATRLIRHKRKLWQSYKRTGSLDDFLVHRRFSNRVKQSLLNLRKDFEESIIASDNNCIKAIESVKHDKHITILKKGLLACESCIIYVRTKLPTLNKDPTFGCSVILMYKVDSYTYLGININNQ